MEEALDLSFDRLLMMMINGAPHHKDLSESGARFRALITLAIVGGKRPWGPLERGHEGLQRINARNVEENELCPCCRLQVTGLRQ